MKKLTKLSLTFVLAMALVVSCFCIQNVSAKASKTVAKPKISVQAVDNTINVTIKKTVNAKGYNVYLKGDKYKNYTHIGTVSQDGTAKRTYTITNLVDGTYSVKVKGFSGKTVSKFSAAKKVNVTSTVPKDLVVLFTSDVHCAVDKGFTYAGLKAIKDKLIADGNQVLLVDDGDAVQGESIGTFTKGESIIELMNSVGYDVATPGNHEFDYGMDQFFNLTKMADFPYVSCNFNKEGKLVFKPYVIKQIGGMKIAFVGISTPDTLTSTMPKYFQDKDGNYIYGFLQDSTGEGVYSAVQKAVDDARAEGAVLVIALAHLGNQFDVKPYTYEDVIANTCGIDVLFDGHSHDSDKVIVKNKNGEDVIRQACGTKFESIGWFRFSIKDMKGDTGLYTWSLSESAIELFGMDNDVAETITQSVQKLDEKLLEVVGTSDVELTIYDPETMDASGKPIRIVRKAETNLGDLCADAYLDQSGADIAIINGGGVRVNIPKGDITLKKILNVHPFGNSMTVIEATGQQILDALEWGCRITPSENGGFPQVAGITFEIHTYIDSTCTGDEFGMFTGITGERRVKNVMVGDEPIDPKKTYTLASHNYMLLEHGDGYTMFDGAKVLQESVKLDNQVLMDYIVETLNGKVGEKYSNPYGEGRIVAVDTKK